ncbi:DUF4292 domain-containing protein [Mucilaginibacter achroorhodeus]|uniref:DUF4292 domain-containing protein n=1 Tax=Mucilaginibacter achroorhodeus TaxID=2599294 RepID=A0A563U0F3_9SPHI|nr:DUF4292 domain-containing protein [Mucilaginibacter achroorhodeus]TWR24850.1 DUF4292 domain-containing protein [Mucilaginibacter achroorhodeus]
MRKNILNSLAIICTIAVLSACKSKKLTQVARPATADSSATVKSNSVREKISAIRSKQVSFNTFTGKAKTKLDINGKGNDVTLNIRINRDQKIWISITAIAGIEVARAQITPDSIQVINRLQSVYLKKPFSYIYQFAGRQVNFKTVQALLIGNAIPETLNEQADITVEGNNTVINGTLQSVVYKLLLGADLKVTQTNLTNQAARQTLQVTNNVFIQENGRIIPSQIDIQSTAGDKQIKANLKYNTVEFDKPLEYPFSIPKSYEPAN